MTQDRLSKLTVAISISDSPDMAMLGLAKEHLDDAMAEVARHLLAMGAHLMYGGDLRPQGFTEVLFELIARHQGIAVDSRPAITNFLAWPVHISTAAEELKELSEALTGVAELVCLGPNGNVMSFDERQQVPLQTLDSEDWANGLTMMRTLMTQMSDARIVLGGRVAGFKGRMPGVAEEVLVALRAEQPLFLLGGFGGCARDITEDLGLIPALASERRDWPERQEFVTFKVENLHNQLDPTENAILAKTVHIDQAVALVLRGLLRLNDTILSKEL